MSDNHFPLKQPDAAAIESRRKPDDPFDGYFNNEDVDLGEVDELINLASARRWFKTLKWGVDNELYTYQQAISGKSGPLVTLNGDEYLTISSYDYLGLIGHPAIEEAAIEAIRSYGTGTGGVRLLTGSNQLHRQLEAKLAEFKSIEAAVTFSSGYAANLAAISSLTTPRDFVVMDELAHRSLTDACRLARIAWTPFRHNDMDSLEEALKKGGDSKRKWIIVEGIYSMDGDICNLPEIVRLKEQYNAFLLVDESHSFGVLGSNGRGVHEHFEIDANRIDVWTSSLSKAIPANGGFVGGSRQMIILLQHQSAPYIFSAALSPPSVAAIKMSLQIIQEDESRLQTLHDNARYFRKQLNLDSSHEDSISPVIPFHLQSEERAYRLAKDLFDNHILASAVAFPAVGPGKARLRLCVTARHNREVLERVAAVIRSSLSQPF